MSSIPGLGTKILHAALCGFFFFFVCVTKIKHTHASAEMSLTSPGGENLLYFLELRQVFLTYDGDLRDLYWWPQERQVRIRIARRPLRIPLPSLPGPKILCGVSAGT